jgi:hypothetical protein
MPDIDGRSFNDLIAQTERLLRRYSAWQPGGNDAGAALVRIFARLAEMVIERLNQVPDKSFLAFLDLIGLELLPPQPARVPLTFRLAQGSTTDALVPARTSVAATPAEGETEPVLFETERELVVTRSQLVAAFTRDPVRHLYSEHTPIATGAVGDSFPVFQGDRSIMHRLYLGYNSLVGIDMPKTITLRIQPVEVDRRWPAAVEWGYWNGKECLPLKATLPAAVGGAWEITLADVPGISATTVDGKTSTWLCGELKQRLSLGEAPLPRIATVRTSIRIQRAGLLPELAFTNQLPIDPTKDFFPFGEKPKFNDTLYLASDEAFSKPGATITLTVALTNPADPNGTPPPAQPSNTLTLVWEFWNRQVGKWDLLGESGPGAKQSSRYDFKDETRAFTSTSDTPTQSVTFTCPTGWAPREENGQVKYWIRVRIVRGDYGREAEYRPGSDGGYVLVPATFRPPSIKSITLGYDYTPPLAAPDYTLTENDFLWVDHSEAAKTGGQAFHPFTPPIDTRPTFYLGFQRPGADTGFAHRATALYFSVAEVLYGSSLAEDRAVAEPPAVTWEYWNGGRWARLGTRDETQGFTRRGLVTFIGPPDLRTSTEFGLTAFWLRARWDSGEYVSAPRLRRVLTNTMWAAHTLTIQNEVLGSSNGEPNQTFRTSQWPVLPGQHIEVREPERPSATEQDAIRAEEGEDAITEVQDTSGRPLEIWVRWHQVPDFYESGPRSRHYTLDRLTGEVRFGDGKRGLVPPQGRSNVRAAGYRTGGGPQGNRPAGAITQLKSAVPYVDSVTHWESSVGGAPQETLEAVKVRGPKTLRHRQRAVAVADFEDLAFEASPPQVARVRGIVAQGSDDAGRVALIIVPRHRDPKPVPSLELLDRVADYISARIAPTVDLQVAGPDWLRVTVTAEIVPVSIEAAADVQAVVLARLAAFLHPLTGGLDGQGWAFGRKPYRSDLHALIEGTPGVDHVRYLSVTEKADDGLGVDRFLVYSGDHQIIMVSEAAA